ALRLEQSGLVPLPAEKQLGSVRFFGGDDGALVELQRVGAASALLVELGEVAERGGTRASIVRRLRGGQPLAQYRSAARAVAQSDVQPTDTHQAVRLV